MPEIKDKFNGFINQIAVDNGLITSQQQDNVLDMQAKFAALSDKGVKPTEKFLDSDPLFQQVRDNWENLAIDNGITSDDLAKRRQDVDSGKGLTKDEAPASGDIAGALR